MEASNNRFKKMKIKKGIKMSFTKVEEMFRVGSRDRPAMRDGGLIQQDCEIGNFEGKRDMRRQLVSHNLNVRCQKKNSKLVGK